MSLAPVTETRQSHGPLECHHMSDRDPLYLFLCHLEWRKHRNVPAYVELIAALDDRDPAIRELAQVLIHRRSPRPICDGPDSGNPELESQELFRK